MSVDKVLIQFDSDIKELRKDMSKAKSDIKGVEKQAKKSSSNLTQSFKNVGAAIAAAFSVQQVIQFTRKSLELYDIQAKAEQSLLVALKGRRDIQQRLIKQAQDLQKVTLFGDEETIRAQAMLAKFGMTEEALTRLIPLIQDYATAQQVDLVTAADLVAKSVGSSTNAMSRYGIEITGAVGSTERLDSAVQSLSDKFEGQAAAAAKVGLGAIQQFQMAWGDFQEEIGEAILPTMTKLTRSIESAMEAAQNGGGRLAPLVDAFRALWQSISDTIAPIREFLGNLVGIETTGTATNTIIEGLARTIDIITFPIKLMGEGIQFVFNKMNDLIDSVKEFIDNHAVLSYSFNVIGKAADKVGEKVQWVADGFRRMFGREGGEPSVIDAAGQANAVFDKLFGHLTNVAAAANAAKKATKEVKKTFDDLYPPVSLLTSALDAAAKAWGNFRQAVTENIEPIISTPERIADAIIENNDRAIKETNNTIQQDEADSLIASQAWADAQWAIANTLFGGLSDLSNQQTAEYITDLNSQLAAGEITEAEFEKMRKDRLRKAAKDQKAFSILSIVLNTAEAVMNALTSKPAAAAPALAAAAGIAGAVQLGLAMNAPLPQFAEGVIDLNGPGTTTSDSILARLSKGESVITAEATRRDKGLLEAINKLETDEYINRSWVLPALQKQEAERREMFDDYRLYRTLRDGQLRSSKDIDRVVDAIQSSRRNLRHVV